MTFPLQKFVIDLLCPAGSVGHFKACVRYLLPLKPFLFLLKLFQAGPDKIGKALQRCTVGSPTCLSVSHTLPLLQRAVDRPLSWRPTQFIALASTLHTACIFLNNSAFPFRQSSTFYQVLHRPSGYDDLYSSVCPMQCLLDMIQDCDIS